MKYNIKGQFICDSCRQLCKGNCYDLLSDIINGGEVNDSNKDLIGRKNIIKCLGKWCPTPCKLQDFSQYNNVNLKPFIDAINFLGQKCNDLIKEKYNDRE